mgnify:CR=1 FL=1
MVFGARPVKDAVTVTFPLPLPADWKPVKLPSEPKEVPHSKSASAARPFGFTVPWRVAEFWVTENAECVVAVGAEPCAWLACVVKERIDP